MGEDAAVEVTDGRSSRVGSLPVRRALPTRGRRTVGPWCFVDHMGPVTFTPGDGASVPPHPHLGLQTVTWLFDGAMLHRDSLGSEVLIRPGQLNLMTAGSGIAHAEEEPAGGSGRLHGMQLWVAQPDATRWGVPEFEHHSHLPRIEVDHGTATVLVGAFAGAVAPSRRDSDHVGVELDLRAGETNIPVDRAHEHALIVAEGEPAVAGVAVRPGRLAYLAPGIDELRLTSATPTLALLVGGVPFGEDLVMWWNFVGRSRDELTEAYRDWVQGDRRFGTVDSGLTRVDVGPPPWLRSG